MSNFRQKPTTIKMFSFKDNWIRNKSIKLIHNTYLIRMLLGLPSKKSTIFSKALPKYNS